MKNTGSIVKWVVLGVIALAIMSKNVQSWFSELFSPTEDVKDRPTTSSTITKNEASDYANRLYQAMIEFSFDGIDLPEVYAVLGKCMNRSDFNMIYNAFGKRQRSNFMGNEGDPMTSSRYDLTFWLSDELDQSQKDYVNKNFPKLNLF